MDKTLRLDIRYATADNFLEKPIYPVAKLYLQKPVAQALVRVQKRLARLGYGLVLYDGYRPWRYSKKMWDECPVAMRHYLAPPWQGSHHNRGCSIDLALIDIQTGQGCEMPSDYDEPSERAHVAYEAGPQQARYHRDILIDAMRAEGFWVQPNEWWHFTWYGWRAYPLLDISFEALGKPG